MLNNLIKRFKPNVGLSNYKDRAEWLKQLLLKIPKDSRILDAGAGTQQYKKYCEHLIYVSQDFAEYDGKGDKSGLQTGNYDYGELDIISDISSIPVPDESFDAVMCIEVLEHVPDPLLALKELSRLLKPAGLLIVTAPFNSLTHFAPYHFCTGFSRFWYQFHLKELGFNSLQISPNGNYFEFLAQELYRLPEVINIYAKRKRIRFILYPFIYIMLHLLKLISPVGEKSSELQCYGFHVVARK